jgi:membrane protein implicated in regulation of membrane protease activity
MDIDSPETWRWIWVALAALLAVGEIAVAGTFFLLSFAIGAAAAAIVAFLDGGVGLQWLAFVATSAVAVGVLAPIGRRLDTRNPAPAAGANRWEGRLATVVTAIPAGLHETGMVRIDREEWRAETTNGAALPEGALVVVARVEGTRLVVIPRPIEVGPPPREAAPPPAPSE